MMLGRRSFLSLLGLAPAIAVVPKRIQAKSSIYRTHQIFWPGIDDDHNCAVAGVSYGHDVSIPFDSGYVWRKELQRSPEGSYYWIYRHKKRIRYAAMEAFDASGPLLGASGPVDIADPTRRHVTEE
jgi:hypothetical protein